MELETGLHGTRVLIVEDDREIAELIAAYIRKEGGEADVASSAEEAMLALGGSAPDLVVLDLGLPGADGFEFLRVFRAVSRNPVIVVSARESDEDKIEGLGLGADDFVSKPFSPRVLSARIKAQLRRAEYRPEPPERFAFGRFTLDFTGRVLERGREPVPLSRREFEILAFLVHNPYRAFNADELHRRVWGVQYGDLSTVAVHIQRIRRKIEDNPSHPVWIRTVPGAGYRFVPDRGRRTDREPTDGARLPEDGVQGDRS